jgi:integrase/recombinase XerD
MQLRLGRIAEDPTALIDAPKLARALPKALSEREVESLLSAPDLDTPAGLRDRAMLELMYASGLRVTELCSLSVDQVNLRQGVVRVRGKGGKDRLVPVGEEAQGWLARYLEGARPALSRAPRSDRLFLSVRGGARGAAGVLACRQAARARLRGACYGQPARAPAFVRHPPVEPRRRSARAADAARAPEPVHDQIYTLVAREQLKRLHERHHPRG